MSETYQCSDRSFGRWTAEDRNHAPKAVREIQQQDRLVGRVEILRFGGIETGITDGSLYCYLDWHYHVVVQTANREAVAFLLGCHRGHFPNGRSWVAVRTSMQVLLNAARWSGG